MVRAHAAVIATVIVWAGAFSAIKALLDHGVAAVDIAVLRYAVATPGFAFLLWRVGGLPRLTGREALRIAVSGALVVVGYHVSLNVGERYTTAGTAALIVALAPAMTVLIASWLGVEQLVPRRVAGLAVAFAGVAVVVFLASGEEVSLAAAKGPLIVLGAPLAFALYNVFLKPLFERFGVLALTAATSLVGTVALLPLARSSTIEAVGSMSLGDGALILYLGVVCTLLGYLGWNEGLRGLGPSRAVTYAYAIPALALAIGAVLLEEPVNAWLAVGGALIVLGVAVAQRARVGAAVPSRAR